MLTFIFWNTNGQRVGNILSELAIHHQADVLMLAECDFRDGEIVQDLNSSGVDFSYCPANVPSRLALFVRFPRKYVEPRFDSGHVTVRALHFPGCDEVLLAIVHLSSQLYLKEHEQTSEAIVVSSDIRRIEEEAGHMRTVVVGDFNLNPFSKGLTVANAFNAVQSRRIAKKRKRTVSGKNYPFFFNPMWNGIPNVSDHLPLKFQLEISYD
ncbi:MAG: endonuclease/exonuclease/phosphatase family protein [Verrucomicrobia bacterium]|nr:endonuclease/exonuclease/phosphatase family protein [Verrucomicrobiota bacterium]